MMTARPQANHCFTFEHDFVGSWRCIPLCVRRKLDLIGLKLKLSHWLELSHDERQRLRERGQRSHRHGLHRHGPDQRHDLLLRRHRDQHRRDQRELD